MADLDSISLSMCAGFSDSLYNHDKKRWDKRLVTSPNLNITTESYANQLLENRRIDRAWNVCYITTIVILLSFLFMWYYFETGECRFCNNLKYK